MKKLWYDDKLWDVKKIISPNGKDHYILLSRERTDQIHSDGKTTPEDMVLVDIGNDEFYPDTEEVRELIRSKKEHYNNIETIYNQLRGKWSSLVAVLREENKGKNI